MIIKHTYITRLIYGYLICFSVFHLSLCGAEHKKIVIPPSQAFLNSLAHVLVFQNEFIQQKISKQSSYSASVVYEESYKDENDVINLKDLTYFYSIKRTPNIDSNYTITVMRPMISSSGHSLGPISEKYLRPNILNDALSAHRLPNIENKQTHHRKQQITPEVRDALQKIIRSNPHAQLYKPKQRKYLSTHAVNNRPARWPTIQQPFLPLQKTVAGNMRF